MRNNHKLRNGMILTFGVGIAWYLWGTAKRNSSKLYGRSKAALIPKGGSALGPAERERDLAIPPKDRIEEASFESFPASDPPAW